MPPNHATWARMRLCGISVKTEIILPEWTTFQTPFEDLTASVHIEKKLNRAITAGRTLANTPGFRAVRIADGCVGFAPPSQNSLPCITATSDYRLITIYESDSEKNGEFIRIPLECRFVHEGVLSLHAACVEEGGRAVCFTGDSGIGKSTRAKTWVDALGAEFISGDRPAIRLKADGCTACGVPWDGKEQIFRNVERPLRAILEVRRAPFIRLRRLTQEQAYRVLVRQCFIPMWDPDTAALAMANVRRLCRSTPVYRMFADPSKEAALETHRTLFERPEEIQEELPEMKIREGFTLRNVADEFIVMPTGENIAKFEGAVVLSDVAAFAFAQLKRPVSREDLLSLILAEYDVDAETATADLDALLAQFREMNLLED